jgi:AmmeMemoRadiSam system protein A
MPFTEAERRALLEVARQSIAHGLRTGTALPVRAADYPESLRVVRATFVTLELGGQLRGCIGTLAAHRPLVEDVAELAFAAAFEDPRFPPVDAKESGLLELHLSVLSLPTPMAVTDEADLLRQLRPNVDGLILGEGARRATFLPAVWEDLPDPREFVRHLKAKAGLGANYWSPRMKAERYTTESFGDRS